MWMHSNKNGFIHEGSTSTTPPHVKSEPLWYCKHYAFILNLLVLWYTIDRAHDLIWKFHLLFEALLVITSSSSPPWLLPTMYKPCFKVILGETEITNRLGSVLCHTSMKQTWQSTHTQNWKTNLKEHSAILVQNRLVKSMDLERHYNQMCPKPPPTHH